MNQQKKSGASHKNILIRVEGKYTFHRGDTFDNFEQVADRLQAHTQESLVYYWIRDSRLVKFAHTKVSRKIDEKLQYYSIKFSCIFGGQRFKSKANGLRPCKRQTRQIDCPAFISLRATKCGLKLEVIDVCNDHTHEISEQAVEELPQKRRPSQALLEEIQELLQLNVDKKMIIDYVKQKENKNILKKDLFNITANSRLGPPRSIDEQKAILHRITLTAVEDDIQQAVLQRLLQIDSDYTPLNPATVYQDNLKSTQNTLDVFDTSTPSAIDFTVLSPEIDLLNTATGVKDEMEYDELLSNRIIVNYEEEETLADKEPKGDITGSPTHENKWNKEADKPSMIYNDFICGDDTRYTYDELELRKEVAKPVLVQVSGPHSPISNHSHDKEYFNDLILVSPPDAICPTDVSLCPAEPTSQEEEGTIQNDEHNAECENPTEPPEGSPKKSVERVRPKDSVEYYARKSRRMILKCRSCGTNARLVKMQISLLKQQRLKLFQETEILKLKKQKLKAEIKAMEESRLL